MHIYVQHADDYLLTYLHHMFPKQSEHQFSRNNHSLPLSPLIIAQGRQHRPTCPYHIASNTGTTKCTQEVRIIYKLL
jgi:hypothetical protein